MKNLIPSVLFLIAVLMSAEGAEEVIFAQVGDQVSLKPPAGFDSKTHYLYWYSGGLELAWRNTFDGSGFHKGDLWEGSLSLSDNSLIIKNIQQQHFGTIVCYVKKNDIAIDTQIYQLIKLNVSVNPQTPLLPGESLSLACNTDKKVVIHWLNPQGEKEPSTQGALKVTATDQHNGYWTCVVTHDKKVNKAKVSVTVLDLSPAPSRPQYTSSSSPLTIPCSTPSRISWEQIKAKGIQGGSWQFSPKPGSSLTSENPQRLFSLSLENPMAWTADKDRGLTPVSALKEGNLSLTKTRGNEEDRGDYVCTLEFKNGVTLSRTVHVDVMQIKVFPGTDLISGQQLNLSCTLGTELPTGLQLKWVPPEKSSLTFDRHSAHLTIPEVGTGDSGKWRCELWQNSTRLTSAFIALKIESKLNVWMLVIICSVTVIVILLLIVTFILYRRRQLKMRHFRHRLCQCKNPKPKGFYRK